MTNPCQQDAGFTLLELLVVTTLSALLMTLVAVGLRYAGDVRSRLHLADDRMVEADAARHVIAQAIAGAYPAFSSAAYSDRRIAFDGKADELSLTGPLPEAIEHDFIGRERFFVATVAGTSALVMAWQLDLPAAASGDSLPEHQVTLLRDVRRLTLRYFGIGPDDKQSSWHDTWSDARRLPELVSVHLDRNGDGLPTPVDLFVEPRIAVNSQCRYDPSETTCLRVQ